jgi:hypothetical protein
MHPVNGAAAPEWLFSDVHEELQSLTAVRPTVEPQGLSPSPARGVPSATSMPTSSAIKVKNERRTPPVFHHMHEETQFPFDPESFFKEPSPEHDSQEIAQPTDHSIREIITGEDPVLLEAGVAQSSKVLQGLR